MKEKLPELTCLDRAAGQFGAFGRQQALQSEMTAREIAVRLRTGQWQAPQRGVYIVSGTPTSWEQRAMVAQLRGGPDAVLSHLTAAHLLGLYHLRPLQIDISRASALHAPGIKVHRCAVDDCDQLRVGPFRVTTPGRTLIDLSSILDGNRLEDCLEEALFQKMVDLPTLAWRFEELGSRGRRGAGALRKLLDLRDQRWAPTETQLETLLHRVLRQANLPLPDRQICIYEEEEFVTRADFAYPAELIAVPADSYEWHRRRRQWETDLRQRNRLMRMGWRIRPTTWTELKRRPYEFTHDISLLLNDGQLRRVKHR
jgi:hypothetical protein